MKDFIAFTTCLKPDQLIKVRGELGTKFYSLLARLTFEELMEALLDKENSQVKYTELVFSQLNTKQVERLLTPDNVIRLLGHPNCSYNVQMVCTARLEQDNLLQPIIGSIWKQNRAGSIQRNFLCWTSAAEAAYRTTQQNLDPDFPLERHRQSLHFSENMLTSTQKTILRNH